MKRVAIICGLAGLLVVSIFLAKGIINKSAKLYTDNKVRMELEKKAEEDAERQAIYTKIKLKADTALAYCKSKNFDVNYCFLVDFSIHSGKNRFFIWNFKTDTIAYSSLCCHGYGTEKYKSTASKIVYSNVEGSYCSSLGKYKTGDRSYSNWGINVHYKLHGLDKTNNNAFKRIVVLHSYELVAEKETYPKHIPLGYSQGCPVISNSIMREVDALLKKTKKPVLLWVYE